MPPLITEKTNEFFCLEFQRAHLVLEIFICRFLLNELVGEDPPADVSWPWT